MWFNPAGFAVNDLRTFGETGKGAYYGPNLHSWDMGLFKNFRMASDMNVQFRAEFFNVFNQLNLKTFEFGSDATTIGFFNPRGNDEPGVLSNNPRFGIPTQGLAGRVVELQARFRF